MLNKYWVLLGLTGILFILPTEAWAAFTNTGIRADSSGSGNATATASVVPQTAYADVPEGLDSGAVENAAFDPNGAAEAYMSAEAYAWEGTAGANAAGTLTETDGTSTVTISGGEVSADAAKEWSSPSISFDPQNEDHVAARNAAFSKIIAAAGNGTVTSRFFDTATGFMLADMDAVAESFGSSHNPASGELQDAAASASGDVTVEHRFDPVNGEPETLTIEGGSVTAAANIEDYNALDLDDISDPDDTITAATAVAWTNGFTGWTAEPNSAGFGFGSRLGLNSVTLTDRGILDIPNASIKGAAGAKGAVNAAFTYRPLPPASTFGLTGNVTGSTAAESKIANGPGAMNYEGSIDAHAGKGAVGTGGTQGELTAPLAAAWLVSNVDIRFGPTWSWSSLAGSGSATAVSPAASSEAESTPGAAMTVDTQIGSFSAAMGSSSEGNAQADAHASVTPGPGPLFYGLDPNDRVTASAVGFAVAAGDDDTSDSGHDTKAAVDGITLFDLGSEYAFVGQGSFVGADEPNEFSGTDVSTIVPVNAGAEVSNVYGEASSPLYSGGLNNGDSDASVTPVLNGNGDIIAYQRANQASADLVTGSNEIAGVSHNQRDGALTIDPNAPWWHLFTDSADASTMLPGVDAARYLDPLPTADVYDNWTGAFIGGGGD